MTDADLAGVLADRTRGASEIEERLLARLLEIVEDGPAEGEPGATEYLLTTLTRGIREHQPSMANLLQLANRAWLRWQEGGDEGDGSGAEETLRRRALVRHWRQRLDGLREREQALAEHLTALAGELWGRPEAGPVTVLTLSRSGTVLAGFGALTGAGWRLVAAVGEGRPGGEGVALARDLRRRGVDARRVTDAAVVALAAGSAPGVDWPVPPDRAAVVVGADAVGPEVFVNKVGTLPLARAARERGLPVLVLADGGKVVPRELFDALELPRAPAEELEEGSDVPALDFHFEQVPLELVSRLVTEEGALRPEEVRQAASAPVSDRLRRNEPG